MLHDPPVAHRLLLALRPPPPLARAIAAAAGWFDGGGGVAAERLHVTLLILDDMVRVPAATIAALRDVAAAPGVAPFELVLDIASGSGRSVALRPARRNPDLARLRERLASRARAHGLVERPGHRFAPHLTLGYREGAPFSRRVAPVAWRAEDLVLIDSHVGRTRHRLLGRWPLVGESDAQLDLL